MTRSAAIALGDLAAINLRSRGAVVAALPRARQAAGLMHAALAHGENPLRELDLTTALRACSFAVSLCESALANAVTAELDPALWLAAGTDPDGEMKHALYCTAAILQSTRLRLGMDYSGIAAALVQLQAAPARDFLLKFLAAADDPEQVLGAYAVSLVDDGKGLRFRQSFQPQSGAITDGAYRCR